MAVLAIITVKTKYSITLDIDFKNATDTKKSNLKFPC